MEQTRSDKATSDHVSPATTSSMELILQAGQEAQREQTRENHLHGHFYGGAAAAQVQKHRQWQKDIEEQEDRRGP